MKSLFITVLLVIGTIAMGLAQKTVEFTCHAPDSIAPNTAFQIRFELKNGQGKGLDILSWNGLELVNGPSTSSSFMSINGETTQSMSFTYTLIAKEEGTYFIPPATIYVNEKPQQTAGKKIVVQKGITAASAPPNFYNLQENFFKESPFSSPPQRRQEKKRKVYRI